MGVHPRSSGRRNFDRQASVLRRRLEKMEDDPNVKDIQEICVPGLGKKATEPERLEAEETASPGSSHSGRFPDEVIIEILLLHKKDSLFFSLFNYKRCTRRFNKDGDFAEKDGGIVQGDVREDGGMQLFALCQRW